MKEVYENNISEYRLSLYIARNHPFFTLTMAFPIAMIACLAPLGMLLPIDSGEKMGYQITLFLSLVVYLDIVSQTVPIPEEGNWTSVPKLIIFFVIIIFLLVICILGMFSKYTVNGLGVSTKPAG